MLRRSRADGEIILIGREADLPYNRPPCSKGYLRGTESREDSLLESAAFYAEHDIEVLTRVSAMKLDPAQRTVTLSLPPHYGVRRQEGSTQHIAAGGMADGAQRCDASHRLP